MPLSFSAARWRQPQTLVAFLLLLGLPWYHFLGWQRSTAFVLLALGFSGVGAAIRRQSWSWALYLWWSLLFLGLAASVRPGESLQIILWNVVLPVLVFAVLVSQRQLFDVLLQVFLVAILLLVLTLSRMAWLGIDPQVGGLPGWRYYPGPGLSSTFLVLALPVAWALYRRAKSYGQRVLPVAVLLAIPWGVYLTLNRMAWVVLALSGALLLFVTMRASLRRPHRLALPIVLMVFACAGLAWKTTQVRMGATSLGQVYTQDARHGVWRYWCERIPSSPWWGHGYGIRVEQAYYRDLGGPASVPPALRPEEGAIRAHAHNLLIDQMVQTGVTGTLSWLILMIGLLWHFLRLARAGEDLAWAAIALILALIIKNMSDDFVEFSVSLTFWSLLALLQAGIDGGRMDAKKLASSAAKAG